MTQNVENRPYAGFCERAIRSLGRRCAGGDVEDLRLINSVAQVAEDALVQAVAGLREQGYSWQMIAMGLGVTRQAAWKRFGGNVGGWD